MKVRIPLDIPEKGSYQHLKKNERLMIAAAVLLGLDNQTAYAMFHPQYFNSFGKLNEAGKQECRNFWSYGKNKDYREAYENYLDEVFDDKVETHWTTEIDDKKIDVALNKLLKQVIGLLDRGDDLDPDSVKTIVDVFRKMNLLKDEEQVEMKPLRFLPLRCWSDGCRYRLFCESLVAEGKAIDECQYCRARKVAEKNGYHYDPQKLLDIPPEVISQLEEKNNTRLEDILNGKIEN